MARIKHRPIRLPASRKRDVRSQFGALCYRLRKGKVQILLITSRTRKRWILPKGWPIDSATPAETALREAWEEAGVEGKVTGNCIGIYTYTKLLEGDDLPCVVAMFPVKVKKLHKRYPEAEQRQRKWCSRKMAAALVDNPELAQMISAFNPGPPHP